MVGPSIVGITTSEISRSTLPDRSSSRIRARLAIFGGQHGIALPRQRPLGDGADHVLVLDQQDGAGAPQLAGFSLAAGLGGALAGRARWTGR
jgi:hypothetical protein